MHGAGGELSLELEAFGPVGNMSTIDLSSQGDWVLSVVLGSGHPEQKMSVWLSLPCGCAVDAVSQVALIRFSTCGFLFYLSLPLHLPLAE